MAMFAHGTICTPIFSAHYNRQVWLIGAEILLEGDTLPRVGPPQPVDFRIDTPRIGPLWSLISTFSPSKTLARLAHTYFSLWLVRESVHQRLNKAFFRGEKPAIKGYFVADYWNIVVMVQEGLGRPDLFLVFSPRLRLATLCKEWHVESMFAIFTHVDNIATQS